MSATTAAGDVVTVVGYRKGVFDLESGDEVSCMAAVLDNGDLIPIVGLGADERWYLSDDWTVKDGYVIDDVIMLSSVEDGFLSIRNSQLLPSLIASGATYQRTFPFLPITAEDDTQYPSVTAIEPVVSLDGLSIASVVAGDQRILFMNERAEYLASDYSRWVQANFNDPIEVFAYIDGENDTYAYWNAYILTSLGVPQSVFEV